MLTNHKLKSILSGLEKLALSTSINYVVHKLAYYNIVSRVQSLKS